MPLDPKLALDFEDADPTLTPNPYSAVTVSAGNGVARASGGFNGGLCQESSFGGTTQDAYGEVAATVAPENAGIVRVECKIFVDALVMPFAVNNTGQELIVLRKAGPAILASLRLWRTADTLHHLRVFEGNGSTFATSAETLTVSTWYSIALILNTENGGSAIAELDGVAVASKTGIGAIPESIDLRVGGGAVAAGIPVAATKVRFDKIVVHQRRIGERWSSRPPMSDGLRSRMRV